MNIREIEVSDVEQWSTLLQHVEAESAYMLWEAGERNVEMTGLLNMIEQFRQSDNSTILVAVKDDELIGYVLARGGNARRNKHSAYIVTGVLKQHRGQGIGTRLFNRLEEWAVSRGVTRLELTVVTQNVNGLSLYEKAGYNIEGTKKNSLIINGEFVDEYYMARILPS